MYMKRTIIFLLLGAAMALRAADSTNGAAAPGSASPKPAKISDLFADVLVAKGKGVEVKRSQLDEMVINVKSSAVAGGQTIPPDRMPMLEQQVLDQLINIQLLMSRATDADKVKGKEVSAKRFDEIRTRAGSEEVLNRQLKSVGMDQDTLKAKMNEEATARAVVEHELGVKVSDEEVKKYYDDNPSDFEEPEKVRASHILLGTRDEKGNELSKEKKDAKRKQADDLVKRARAGEDFAKMAKEFSDDPGSKDKGGEYTFPRGQMVPEFEAAAFALKTNQVSDVVTTQFGYHVIKLSEKFPATKVDFEKSASHIRDFLSQKKLQKEIPTYMAKLRKEANVEILDERLKMQDESSGGLQPPQQPAIIPPKK
jgi:parvulin-like peptidyl-prolyl isomerase